jgi:MoaA/NifB/PqqE/SkfB family radical SAM enzyme
MMGEVNLELPPDGRSADADLSGSGDGAVGLVRRAARYALPVVKLGVRRLMREKSPFQMTLSLTNHCNFRCTYCEIPLQHRGEMSTAEWCAAIDDLHAAGMGRACVMGGEPLLRKDVGPIVRHLKRRGVHASLNTNGWLVADRIDDLVELDLACVSLDGPAHVQNAQRHPASYDRVIQAIELLRRRNVPTVTMTVVTPAGIDHIDHVLDVARAHGIRAWFHLEHDKEVDRVQSVSPELSQTRIAELAQHLADLKRRGLPVGNSFGALARQGSHRYLTTCDACYAGTYFGYVFSDGTLAHCIFTQAHVPRGNGRKDGYSAAFRALPAPQGDGCSCLPYHEVNRMLNFDMRVLFSALDVALRPAAS